MTWSLLDFWLKPLCQPSWEYAPMAVIYCCVIMPVCLITDFEFYQAACPPVSGNQLLWSAKKPEVLCQTLLINWERAWAQLQVALRKFQEHFPLYCLVHSMNWELSRGVILHTELNSPLKIVPHWITAHGLACLQRLLNSVGVFQMTTVRAGLSPQSETRYFSEKKNPLFLFLIL